MKYAGTQTVYPCKEHEEVHIPFAALLRGDGQLDLYPEVAGKGYFDIDYRQGQLVLRSKGFVGFIPISDKVAIHVEPRAPIGNLLYMVWRAGVRLLALTGFVRGYQESRGIVENAEELYVSAFLSALRKIRTVGLLKKYLSRETELEKRGRLLLGATVSRFHAAGRRHRHVFQLHELTADNCENRILKRSLERLARHFLHDPAGVNREVARELREVLSLFSDVDASGITDAVVGREALGLIRGLPRNYRFYESAIWLAYLIATNSGVVMERVGRAKFETLIIDVSAVFEKYVRALLREAAIPHFGGCRVFDGNVRQVPLFVTNSQFVVQPDYYFQRGVNYAGVADAKYKPRISTEDRHSLLAFCEALGVKKAAFICPAFPDEPLTYQQGTTRGGIEVYVVRIDLRASDLAGEEDRFKAQMATVLGLSAPLAA